MLEIHQKTDFIGYEDKIARIDAEFPAVLESYDNGRVNGYCIFSIEGDTACIYDLSYGGDIALCDGLARSALFKASMLGIDKAKFFTDDENVKKLKLCDESGILVSIQSVMGGCSNCHK